ncbi:MAG: P27 family phage terminase small subunit [Casimicrobiaceae bacterium]
MPRKSAAATLAVVDVRHKRIKAPAELPAPVRAIWSRLVDALPGDRFHSSDGPLLALYCRALHQADLAFGQLEEFGAWKDEHNPWLKVADITTKQCATLASKLRLCPQARLDRKVAGPAARDELGGPAIWERLSDDDARHDV